MFWRKGCYYERADSSPITDNTAGHRMMIHWLKGNHGRTYNMYHCWTVDMKIVDCGLVQNNFTTLCDWLRELLWMLPTAADQWGWSFNSANVTVEVFHIRLNESVTHTPSTHHIHSAFPASLSFSLIHMLKVFSDSYSMHKAVNYLSSLIKQSIHSLQDCSFSLSFSHWFRITQNNLFLSVLPFIFNILYPVSTFCLLAFLLFSTVLHLPSSSLLVSLTLSWIHSMGVLITVMPVCLCVCCRYD